MKRLLFAFVVLLVLAGLYFAGPRFKAPVLDNTLPNLDTINTQNVEQYVISKESKYSIKANNHAQIIWFNDSIKEMTEYALLYLHGFSACWYEGFPVNADFAKYFGCNAYFSRLASHGLKTSNPLIDMYPDSLYESAKEALQITSKIGKKVIIMGTSTGGTLALKLAADFPEKVTALILLSPNIKIYDKRSAVLTKPWGLQIARLVGGSGKYSIKEPVNAKEDSFWYTTYRWEGAIFLQQLVQATMTKEVFEKVEQPLFVGYYYKNSTEQDHIVQVPAIIDMFNEISTPDDLKVKMVLPEAGTHIIGNELFSKSVPELKQGVIDFGTEILKMHEAKAIPDSLLEASSDSINAIVLPNEN